MTPLLHISFSPLLQPVCISSVHDVLNDDDIGTLRGELHLCHQNATLNCRDKVSQWGTPIEYVEGYARGGLVAHAFNRTQDNEGRWRYFDQTLELNKPDWEPGVYYYACRAFSYLDILRVVMHYNTFLLTISPTLIKELRLKRYTKGALDNAAFFYNDKGDFVVADDSLVAEQLHRQTEIIKELASPTKK